MLTEYQGSKLAVQHLKRVILQLVDVALKSACMCKQNSWICGINSSS